MIFETFFLNGKEVSGNALFHSNPKTKLEEELFAFLREWYSPVDFIEVQTSGSTGIPKKITLKKKFIEASALRTLKYFKLNSRDRVLHCLPCKYIAGKLMIIRALIGHLDLYMVDPSTDFDFLREAGKFRFAAMVPNQVASIPNELLPQIEQLLIGGGSIPPSLQKRLENAPTKIYSSYAMTETATHIAICSLNGEYADGWYHCLENIRVSLSSGNCLRIEMPGLKEPFLQTNDIAELNDNKTFRILGRADHVIISGGAKYHPEQLEKKLEQYISLPFMIAALPHDKLGEQIVIVLEGESADKEQIIEICSTCLSHYEQPREIIFTERLPRTSNGKLKRKYPYSTL